ncbi:hypothetical protein [Arthrobacter sp. NPDC090010]|uniref:hypothetical protein n=1 Tax=Arthrobacter sp. NPDC090010 TaxID=3363942 RepID=UPI003827BAC9
MSLPRSADARSRRRWRLYTPMLLAAVLVLASFPVAGFTGAHLLAAVVVIFVFVALAIDTNPGDRP